MPTEILIQKAQSDLGSSKKRLIIALAVCLIVFALNYKFLYNVAVGPFDAASVNLEDPGAVAYVASEGTFLNVGSQQKGLKVLGVKAGEGVDVGQYYLHPVNEKFILVYTDNDFAGDSVLGKLTRIPEDMQAELAALDQQLYPYMIDGYVGYGLSPNLFMLVAIGAFPILLLLLLLQVLKKGDPYKHPQIAKLKEFGEPHVVVQEIEAEMAANGAGGEVPLVHVSPKWVVVIGDSLKIFSQDSLVAYGALGEKGGKHLVFFERGKLVETSLYFPGDMVEQACERLRALLPEKFVADTKAYQKRWDPKNPPELGGVS